ncbi:hypothetical protein ZIOFF_018556 [Zingiber officinale]|uniref:Uncharacterized protein n=1 Tax=Zingiber officinale TaxID=94328 RepID=A0A8J5H8D4_ZINOF|nr:hypothetical protein ZIOFF_018556 [Zingiber officinale]
MQMRKNKLDKKLKSIKPWRKVLSIIFMATLTTFLTCSIVATAIVAPPIVVAAVAAIPFGSMGKYSKREDTTNDLNTSIETSDLEGIEKYNKRTVKVLEELRLTMDQFIDLCILSGCDYCDNIKVEYGVSAATVPCLCYLDLI